MISTLDLNNNIVKIKIKEGSSLQEIQICVLNGEDFLKHIDVKITGNAYLLEVKEGFEEDQLFFLFEVTKGKEITRHSISVSVTDIKEKNVVFVLNGYSKTYYTYYPC